MKISNRALFFEIYDISLILIQIYYFDEFISTLLQKKKVFIFFGPCIDNKRFFNIIKLSIMVTYELVFYSLTFLNIYCRKFIIFFIFLIKNQQILFSSLFIWVKLDEWERFFKIIIVQDNLSRFSQNYRLIYQKIFIIHIFHFWIIFLI